MSQDEETTQTPAAEAAPSEPAGQEATQTETQTETQAAPEPGAAARGELAELRDRVTGLEREVSAERERASDYMRRWQQAQADLANARRRAQQEQEQLLTLAANQAAALVLPALDSLERAFNTLPEGLHHLTWIEGISLVEFQLRRVLEAHGVAPFEPKLGDTFDPARHQAIAEVETSEHPTGSVAQVAQRGYEMSGRVLRPALICMAREPTSGGTSAAQSPQTGQAEPEPSASGP